MELTHLALQSAPLTGFVFVCPIGFLALKPVLPILARFLFSAPFLFFTLFAAVAHICS
jgi:hypothetical protein